MKAVCKNCSEKSGGREYLGIFICDSCVKKQIIVLRIAVAIVLSVPILIAMNEEISLIGRITSGVIGLLVLWLGLFKLNEEFSGEMLANTILE